MTVHLPRVKATLLLEPPSLISQQQYGGVTTPTKNMACEQLKQNTDCLAINQDCSRALIERSLIKELTKDTVCPTYGCYTFLLLCSVHLCSTIHQLYTDWSSERHDDELVK